MRRKFDFSVAEIAERAGVSCATVSRVLNNRGIVSPELVERVCAALVEKGVEPHDVISQSPQPGKLILFTLPFDFNSFFNEIVRGAKASSVLHGYQLLVLQEHINANTFPAFEKLIRDLKVSGLIVLNHLENELLNKLYAIMPIVQCCDYDRNSRLVSSVSLDDVKSAKLVMDYFATLGRKRVAFMSGSLKYKDNLYRKEGYLRGLSEMGVEPNDSWIVHLPEINYNMALSTATQILSQPNHPDAFFAISDLFASAVINAARRLDLRVPEDIAVVGFDNVDYALISTPTITTVNTPKFQFGYTASELLIEKIQNPNAVTQHIYLPSELIVRESTAVR